MRCSPIFHPTDASLDKRRCNKLLGFESRRANGNDTSSQRTYPLRRFLAWRPQHCHRQLGWDRKDLVDTLAQQEFPALSSVWEHAAQVANRSASLKSRVAEPSNRRSQPTYRCLIVAMLGEPVGLLAFRISFLAKNLSNSLRERQTCL